MTRFVAERLGSNPIIHPGLSPSIGTNINGPSVIRVPNWVSGALGRYYLYFADHRGDRIRLAYADAIAGPWRIYAPGALDLPFAGFPVSRDELTPPEIDKQSVASGNLRPHIASPDVHVDHDRRQIVMHFHGLEVDCTQTTRRATSEDGLAFRSPAPTGADFYARVFAEAGEVFAATLAGWYFRSDDGGRTFREATRLGAPSTRHVAVFRRDGVLYVVFSVIGDAPERLLISKLETAKPWPDWRLEEAAELLRAEAEWEGGHLPIAPSRMGPADEPVNQLRDPYVFEDDDQLWLFYACAGEAGIGVARLHSD